MKKWKGWGMADKRLLQLKEALKKDFRKLYVREFTTNWEIQRLLREIEIDVMDLDNTLSLFSDKVKKE